MKGVFDIFRELGTRLEGFGSDECTMQIISNACSENPWFSPCDIVHAVDSIRRSMLSPEALFALSQRYTLPYKYPRKVAIIMAGNIPLVGFSDLMAVLLAGDIPYVKHSQKDRVMMEFVENELRDIEPLLQIEEFVSKDEVDMAIATGSDSAALHFESEFSSKRILLRSSRHSVAVLGGKENSDRIEALADDMFLYSGLGCRSVCMVFVPLGYVLSLPRREMNVHYHNNYRQWKAVLEMQGEEFQDAGFCIMRQGEASFAHALSEIRIVHYQSLDEVREWILSHDSQIQCVSTDLADIPFSVPLGRTQSPLLTDWADREDVFEFLEFR